MAELVSDSGAYAALSPWVLLYSLVTAAGPYRVPHVKVDAGSHQRAERDRVGAGGEGVRGTPRRQASGAEDGAQVAVDQLGGLVGVAGAPALRAPECHRGG